MKVAVFSTKSYDRHFFNLANEQHHHELIFLESRLNHQTARLVTNILLSVFLLMMSLTKLLQVYYLTMVCAYSKYL
jgi:hypothetical protein